MSSEPNTENPQQPRAWWRRYFPLCWWTLLLVAFVVVRSLGLESDLENVFVVLIANLAAWVPLGWMLFAWPPMKQLDSRWWWRLAAVAVLVGGFRSIDVEYDGDGRWKSVRFAWQPAPDQQLDVPAVTEPNRSLDWQTTANDYPRFLGNGYWAEVSNVQLASDWQAAPPELLWKQPIGAGWSSFAVVGNYAITQEQRGTAELVTCYRVSDGKLVWTHADETRHDPGDVGGGMGGVGPRATPTIRDGRVYTMGATGIVNCLDATTGTVVWSHHMEDDYQVAPLLWGNSGSPLVVADKKLVIVNSGVVDEERSGSLYAFELDSGKVAWVGGPAVTSYASPVEATLGGVRQIIQVNEATVGGYRLSDGQQLWQFDQPGSSSGQASCSQAIPLSDDRVLVSKGYGMGARLYKIVANDSGDLSAKGVWQKRVLKTKLSNLVVRDGYAYGLDHTFLCCVQIDNGRVKWKKRRTPSIGHGQVMLVGDKLLVLTEAGEGVLVECQPNKYVELASMQLLTDEGVTWNNPALAGQNLLVRNNLEAACYRLPLEPQVETLAAGD